MWTPYTGSKVFVMIKFKMNGFEVKVPFGYEDFKLKNLVFNLTKIEDTCLATSG